MALKRRIVLEDSQIVSTVPVSEPPPKLNFDIGWDEEWLHDFPNERRRRDFDKLSKIGAQAIRCPLCKHPDFDADFTTRTVKCLGCQRVLGFDAFYEEHR